MEVNNLKWRALFLSFICAATPTYGLDFLVSGYCNVTAAALGQGRVWQEGILPGSVTTVETVERDNDFLGIIHAPTFNNESLIGLQLNALVSDKLSVIAQLQSRGADNFTPNMKWMFINYQFDNNFAVKAGRILTPLFLFSQHKDVNYIHPWLRPPVEVYNNNVDDALDSITGINLNYYRELFGSDFNFNILYSGDKVIFPLVSEDIEVKIKNCITMDVSYGNDTFLVRIGYSHLKMDVNSLPASINLLNTSPLANAESRAIFQEYQRSWESNRYIPIGFKFDYHNFYSLGEYTRYLANTTIAEPSFSWYLTLGYKYNDYKFGITTGGTRSTKKEEFQAFADRIANSGFGGSTFAQFYARDLLRIALSDQDSLGLDAIWYPTSNLALKSSIYHYLPRNDHSGLFTYKPGRGVNVYSISVQTIF